MNFKGEPSADTRKGWLFVALGIAFGIAAVLILMLRAVKMGG
jgi:Mg2+ and Co2+ transporter CorA